MSEGQPGAEEDPVGRQVAISVERVVRPMGAVDSELGGTIVTDFGWAVRVHLFDGSFLDLATQASAIGISCRRRGQRRRRA